MLKIKNIWHNKYDGSKYFEKTKNAIKKILKINDDALNSLPLIHMVTQASAWGFVYYDEIDDKTKEIIKTQMKNLQEKGNLIENL